MPPPIANAAAKMQCHGWEMQMQMPRDPLIPLDSKLVENSGNSGLGPSPTEPGTKGSSGSPEGPIGSPEGQSSVLGPVRRFFDEGEKNHFSIIPPSLFESSFFRREIRTERTKILTGFFSPAPQTTLFFAPDENFPGTKTSLTFW